MLKWINRLWFDPGPDRGWSWVIVVSSCVINAGTFGISTTGCAGVLFTEFLLVFGITREEAMWTFSIMGISQSIAGGLSNILCQYFSRRLIVIGSSLIGSLGFILSYFSPSYLFTSIVLGITFGISVGLGSVMSGVTVCQYFRKHLISANGLFLTGAPTAGFLAPFLLSWLISVYGLKGAMLIFGGLLLNLVPMAALLRPRTGDQFPSLKQVPEQGQLLQKTSATVNGNGKSSKEEKVSSDNENKPKNRLVSALATYVELFKEPMFYVVSMHSVFCINYLISISLTFADFMMDNGFKKSQGVMMLSVFAMGDLVARVFFGWIADRQYFKTRTLAGMNLLFMGLATFALCATRNIIIIGLLIALIGMMEGSANVLINVLYRQYLGIERLTAALGMRLFFNGLVSFSRPFLVGAFRDSLGSYVNFYYVLGAITTFGGILWAVEPWFTHQKNKTQPSTIK